MHYQVEVVVDLPREKVIELFDNPDNMPKWQAGLLSFEPISGTPGEPGAKSKLVYQMGKRRIEMIETITVRNLPDQFDGTYDTAGIFNEVRNRFSELGPNQTKWESENDFQFTSFMMKVMGQVMKNAFPKQSLKYMEDFKAFAERGIDVRDKQPS